MWNAESPRDLQQTKSEQVGNSESIHETLLQHTHRFKNARDVMKTKNGGFLVFDALMEKAITDYDIIKINSFKLEEAKKKTNERWLAYLFIENSDKTRHGSMIKLVAFML